jgi:hypothetical protein
MKFAGTRFLSRPSVSRVVLRLVSRAVLRLVSRAVLRPVDRVEDDPAHGGARRDSRTSIPAHGGARTDPRTSIEKGFSHVFSGVAWVSGAAGRGAAYPWGPLRGVDTGNARPALAGQAVRYPCHPV